jgi:hypothetical protein
VVHHQVHHKVEAVLLCLPDHGPYLFLCGHVRSLIDEEGVDGEVVLDGVEASGKPGVLDGVHEETRCAGWGSRRSS